MADEEFEGLTVEETDALNEDALAANEPTDEEIERVQPDLPPAPYTEQISVSPVDPNSDPGRAKAAREEAEAAEEEPDES